MEAVDTMSISDLLAFAAMLVAALSALYARWTWCEAIKANRISLHQHQKHIYDAFFKLKMHMTEQADLAEISSVTKFYYSSRNAPFYFEASLAQKLKDYYDQCFFIANSNSKKVNIDKRFELMEKSKLAAKLAEEIEPLMNKAITLVH